MLKHDGVLILDQRNYDAMLDRGFSSKHTYYYCGEDVAVEPEYLDEGLCRMRYNFPDNSVYHLNMFPLRKDYTRRLMSEVGFQHIETYGDFQHTYREEQPDFFVHVAEKEYRMDEEGEGAYSAAVSTARTYYNSSDADEFYASVWGGEDIHIGLYESDDEPIADASRRTVQRMAEKLDLNDSSVVLDLGAGFGGSARYVAETYGCRVIALNLSEVENERNRRLNEEQGLDHLIDVVDGSFEDLPFQDKAYDIVWSQDAFLHSGDRVRVLEEAVRVMKPRARVVFTDPMAANGAPKDALVPILERLSLDTMASPDFYRRELYRLGMGSVTFHEASAQLPRHYQRVLDETERRSDELSGQVSDAYLERMKVGLRNWVDGGNAGNLTWGIFTAEA
jgi:cyclopropane fatty-acyl-phospholipid synthase-like methyltransferase